MLSKKSERIIRIILLTIMLLTTVSNFVFAEDIPTVSTHPIMEGQVSQILGIIQYAGYAIAVGMAMVLGIKYVTSSPDGKAEIKKTLTIYIGGIALITLASSIVGAIKGSMAGNV